jgi:hypothetical protein
LAAREYELSSAAGQLQVMAHLSRWLVDRGLDGHDLTSSVVEEFLRARRVAGYRQWLSTRGMAPRGRAARHQPRDHGAAALPLDRRQDDHPARPASLDRDDPIARGRGHISRRAATPLPRNPGQITTSGDTVTVRLDRRAYTPVLRQADVPDNTPVPWWGNRTLRFEFS